MGRYKQLIALVSSHTDCGDKRETNDDSILAMRRIVNGHMICLYVVADGCGGMSGGSKASRLITQSLMEWMEECINNDFFNENLTDDYINRVLDKEIDLINEYVIEKGKGDGLKTASTMSLLFTVDDRYYIKHTGDSRIYRIRWSLKQLTEDQTLVADMVRNGSITRREAKTHQKRHVLNMCMGYYKNLRIFSSQGNIKNNDIFLICSDGLYNSIGRRKLVKNSRRRDFVNNAQRLRKAILAGKALDNVSVILVKYKIRRCFMKRNE